MNPDIYIKVYTIEIKPNKGSKREIWYANKAGKMFSAVMVVKETEAGHSYPSFLVIKKSNKGFHPPMLLLYVRLLDCEVFYEQVIRPSMPLRNFIDHKRRRLSA